MGVEPPREPFHFSGFVLDPARGALFDAEGAERPLRPKSYALLLFLLQNAGHLVDRDRILVAVWPGVFVTDDSITQCVGEIRRALGGAGPQLLRTVPRRGYLFEGAVSRGPVDPMPGAALGPAEVAERRPAAAGDAAPAAAIAEAPAGIPTGAPSRFPDALAPNASVPGALAPGALAPDALAMSRFRARLASPRRGWPLLAGAAALLLLILPPLLGRRTTPDPGATVAAAVPPATPREEATRLLLRGLAVGCPEFPCPREWLAERELYERAIAADPDFAPPYARAAFTYTNFVSSGLSLNEAEDRRAAEQLATRAAALAPELAVAHEARAAVLRQDPARLEGALSAYLRSLSIDANNPSVRANAGWMLVLLGRPAEAEPYLKAALALAPEHGRAPAWLTYLGLAELFLGRDGHGADRFRRALAQQSGGAAATDAGLQRGLNLAAALALDGVLDEARLVVEGLRRQHPALSTRTLWNCDCSREPGFLDGYAVLRRGVVLAGVPDTR